ncbi:hypothetical protein HDU99_006135, partial [Rhizoclosmatium hyalinum]
MSSQSLIKGLQEQQPPLTDKASAQVWLEKAEMAKRMLSHVFVDDNAFVRGFLNGTKFDGSIGRQVQLILSQTKPGLNLWKSIKDFLKKTAESPFSDETRKNNFIKDFRLKTVNATEIGCEIDLAHITLNVTLSNKDKKQALYNGLSVEYQAQKSHRIMKAFTSLQNHKFKVVTKEGKSKKVIEKCKWNDKKVSFDDLIGYLDKTEGWGYDFALMNDHYLSGVSKTQDSTVQKERTQLPSKVEAPFQQSRTSVQPTAPVQQQRRIIPRMPTPYHQTHIVQMGYGDPDALGVPPNIFETHLLSIAQTYYSIELEPYGYEPYTQAELESYVQSYVDNVKCYGCGEIGHFRRNCPNAQSKETETKLESNYTETQKTTTPLQEDQHMVKESNPPEQPHTNVQVQTELELPVKEMLLNREESLLISEVISPILVVPSSDFSTSLPVDDLNLDVIKDSFETLNTIDSSLIEVEINDVGVQNVSSSNDETAEADTEVEGGKTTKMFRAEEIVDPESLAFQAQLFPSIEHTWTAIPKVKVAATPKLPMHRFPTVLKPSRYLYAEQPFTPEEMCREEFRNVMKPKKRVTIGNTVVARFQDDSFAITRISDTQSWNAEEYLRNASLDWNKKNRRYTISTFAGNVGGIDIPNVMGDSCSSCGLITLDLVNRLPTRPLVYKYPRPTSTRGIGGEQPLLGYVDVEFCPGETFLRSQVQKIRLHVCMEIAKGRDVLLGTPQLDQFGIKFNFENEMVNWKDNQKYEYYLYGDENIPIKKRVSRSTPIKFYETIYNPESFFGLVFTEDTVFEKGPTKIGVHVSFPKDHGLMRDDVAETCLAMGLRQMQDRGIYPESLAFKTSDLLERDSIKVPVLYVGQKKLVVKKGTPLMDIDSCAMSMVSIVDQIPQSLLEDSFAMSELALICQMHNPKSMDDVEKILKREQEGVFDIEDRSHLWQHFGDDGDFEEHLWKNVYEEIPNDADSLDPLPRAIQKLKDFDESQKLKNLERVDEFDMVPSKPATRASNLTFDTDIIEVDDEIDMLHTKHPKSDGVQEALDLSEAKSARQLFKGRFTKYPLFRFARKKEQVTLFLSIAKEAKKRELEETQRKLDAEAEAAQKGELPQGEPEPKVTPQAIKDKEVDNIIMDSTPMHDTSKEDKRDYIREPAANSDEELIAKFDLSHMSKLEHLVDTTNIKERLIKIILKFPGVFNKHVTTGHLKVPPHEIEIKENARIPRQYPYPEGP